MFKLISHRNQNEGLNVQKLKRFGRSTPIKLLIFGNLTDAEVEYRETNDGQKYIVLVPLTRNKEL